MRTHRGAARTVNQYHVRLGRIIGFAQAQDLRMSRVRQICRTWRSYLAWWLQVAMFSVSDRKVSP